MAQHGALSEAQAIAARAQDATLSVSAARWSAWYAKDAVTLRAIAASVAHLTAEDALGRDPQNVAHIAISESNVSGKSRVLLELWKRGVQPALDEHIAEPELLRTSVLGMAMSCALWTDTDLALVSALLEGQHRPGLAQA